LVTVDKFSKWIKVVSVTNQEATMIVKFFESITCRYRVPNSIITDNGTNFTSGELVAHPNSNGQVNKANGLVCAGLKKRLVWRALGSKSHYQYYGVCALRPTLLLATRRSSNSS
jgi:hypothetical protein